VRDTPTALYNTRTWLWRKCNCSSLDRFPTESGIVPLSCSTVSVSVRWKEGRAHLVVVQIHLFELRQASHCRDRPRQQVGSEVQEYELQQASY
jgi:hypothetical protein